MSSRGGEGPRTASESGQNKPLTTIRVRKERKNGPVGGHSGKKTVTSDLHNVNKNLDGEKMRGKGRLHHRCEGKSGV